MSEKKKKVFEVAEGESIDACLDRIKAAGYVPIKRTEKPIFEEKVKDGKVEYDPTRRKIVFEAKLIE
ncbi:NETI motif-containing protein [Peribacillus cavernae]|uniref:NETI motif-containing protein n=1 Tax=Peribacillus cavernae TaxID=1674310 RepID=A0A3S0VVW5_9BACI|nr:NETI motif-containing protein [Peribacillus cavernae]MDQ0219850.1 hypothetical protein [Peribacillus cavernae]RUQ27241.1 NETI motif-containing protein [Peribacillus cavernae]